MWNKVQRSLLIGFQIAAHMSYGRIIDQFRYYLHAEQYTFESLFERMKALTMLLGLRVIRDIDKGSHYR